MAGAEDFGFCDSMRIGPSGHALPVSASSVTPLTDAGCEDFVDDAELATASFGQARVTVTPTQMALVAATIANGGVMMEPFIVREVLSPDPAGGASEVVATYDSPGRRSVVSRQTADEVRAVMVDAVHGPLGAPYAGSANVALYGIGGVQTAGKTGTAERGNDLPPHSWFIGFAAAQPGRCAEHRDRGHRGRGRPRIGHRGAHRRPGHGRMAAPERELKPALGIRPNTRIKPIGPFGASIRYEPLGGSAGVLSADRSFAIVESAVNVQEPAERTTGNIERVIVGKHAEVRLAMVALLCEGHILIEDVPGVGKTMLAKALSRSIGTSFRRIQFTPDLLPSDVTGLSIFNQKTQDFEFRPGPIMAQIVLADEINRATPKTQSALLECMEERQATIDGVSHQMPSPFLVIATQNPIEYEGTFALPEAQLDRFLLRIRLGYPKPMEELVILDEQKRLHPIESIQQVLSLDELRLMQAGVKEIYVDQGVADYIIRLVTATREHADVYLGASPRGSLHLYRAAQALAAINGRDYVIPDDVKQLAVPVLGHRLIVRSQASLREVDNDAIVREVLSTVAIAEPTEAAAPA